MLPSTTITTNPKTLKIISKPTNQPYKYTNRSKGRVEKCLPTLFVASPRRSLSKISHHRSSPRVSISTLLDANRRLSSPSQGSSVVDWCSPTSCVSDRVVDGRSSKATTLSREKGKEEIEGEKKREQRPYSRVLGKNWGFWATLKRLRMNWGFWVFLILSNTKLGVGGFGMGGAMALYSATCFAFGKYGNGNRYPINLRASCCSKRMASWFKVRSSTVEHHGSYTNSAARLGFVDSLDVDAATLRQAVDCRFFLSFDDEASLFANWRWFKFQRDTANRTIRRVTLAHQVSDNK
ncbi:hypothetical protein Droror1_Dr00002426 [Drosera rotundifolia]